MTAPHADQIIGAYMTRLRGALADAAPRQREPMLDDIMAHIEEGRSLLVEETDADLLNLLERLGDPVSLAEAAAGGGGAGGRPTAAGRRQTAMVLGILLAGAIVAPFLGSRAWMMAAACLVFGGIGARSSGSWSNEEVTRALVMGICIFGFVPLLTVLAGDQLLLAVLRFGPSLSPLVATGLLGRALVSAAHPR